MNALIRISLVIAGLLVVNISHGQSRLEMPMIGDRLPAATFDVVNQIPKSHLAGWPESLPVYRYSEKPCEFHIESLQKLADQSAFAGTNIADAVGGTTNGILSDKPLKLESAKGRDSFYASPARGSIVVEGHGYGIDIRRETPAFDAVPDFDAIRDRVIEYARMFGISTNDMERKEDGQIHLLKTEDKTVKLGGAIKFISRRSVGVKRSVNGYLFLANDNKLELALGVNGWMEQFNLIWPAMTAIRTNQLLTIDRLFERIKQGGVLGDASNEYPADGIAQIVLKDARIEYYGYSPRGFGTLAKNTEIMPVVSFHAVFKSKAGKTTEGGLYADIVDSK